MRHGPARAPDPPPIHSPPRRRDLAGPRDKPHESAPFEKVEEVATGETQPLFAMA